MFQPIVDHTVVNLIGEDYDVLLHADLGDLGQLLPRENLADGIVGRVDDHDLGLWRESRSELVNVNLPVLTRGVFVVFRRWVKRDKDSVGTLESDRRVVLVKVRLDQDDFVPGLQESGEGSMHTCDQHLIR